MSFNKGHKAAKIKDETRMVNTVLMVDFSNTSDLTLIGGQSVFGSITRKYKQRK